MEELLMHTYTKIIAIPLFAFSASVFAQSSAAPPTTAAPADKAAGNNLTGPQDTSPNAAANPANPPASASPQQKASGNNLVTQQQAGNAMSSSHSDMSSRPDFDQLDGKKTGYLTQKDAAGNQWFKANFSKCDIDHDGHVTRDEYVKCSQ
jgi:hypothetical protein